MDCPNCGRLLQYMPKGSGLATDPEPLYKLPNGKDGCIDCLTKSARSGAAAMAQIKRHRPF
jgi:hypothetical protein